MIELNNVTKSYNISRKQQKEMGDKVKGDLVVAVDKISFTCKPGRVFGLIGPNGAGKTTTLRMIATMLNPSVGTITVNGYNVVKEPYNVRKSLGFLSGNTGLYDRLTCEEMVQYYADLHGLSKSNYKNNRDKIFNMLSMDEFIGRRIGKLSTGMKQKVNIARTMIHDPMVVVFDEPTSGLDIMTSRSIIKLIQDCKKMGKTVIFSSHRLGEVRALCDDIAIIHKGKLFFNDTFEEFKRQMKSESLEDEFVRLVDNNG